MLLEAASVLAKLHMNCAIAKAWRDWCRRELRQVAKNNTNTQWWKEEKLEGIGPLSLQGVPEEIKAGLRRCKQKLMEANWRSRQLGCGERRVALVCCYNWTKSLKSELEVELEKAVRENQTQIQKQLPPSDQKQGR